MVMWQVGYQCFPDLWPLRSNPANTIHWNNVVLMLGQRRRRWANVKTTLFQCIVFAGNRPTTNICHFLVLAEMGGGPRLVASTAAFHARVRSSVPGLGGLKETKNVSSPSTCESQYCGEPPWPRGSVLGLTPPGLEFRILCLEDSVISSISPSPEGAAGPV